MLIEDGPVSAQFSKLYHRNGVRCGFDPHRDFKTKREPIAGTKSSGGSSQQTIAF